MNKQIEALKMAIEELEYMFKLQDAMLASPDWGKIYKACKEALAEAEKQEDYPSKEEILNKIFDAVYTQYPKKEWQSLSDDEMKIIQNNSWIINADGSKEFNTFVFARAIEQALKEKNHG